MDCSFCKKTFSTKTILSTHQRTAKYCLEIQGKENKNFECEYCKKIFTSLQSLTEHNSNSCKEKKNSLIREEYVKQIEDLRRIQKEKEFYYENMLKEKDNEIVRINQIVSHQKETINKLEANIEKLEANIEKLEIKLEKFEDSILSKTEKKPVPNTTNNTTNIVINNNYLNLNDIPKMTAFLEEKLDKEVVAGGQKGLALLLSNTVLKDKYKCVDPSRQNFEFTNELGEVERDVKAKKLTNALIKSDICAKSGEIGMELWKKEDGSTDSLRYEAHSKNVLEMINFTRDNSTFRSELSALTS
jgi:C2H2-type zinc finger